LTKVTPQQIVAIHRLRAESVGVSEIAYRLGVHRNTITKHLHGRVAYSPEILRKIGGYRFAEFDTQDKIDIYTAAPLIPDQPSPQRLHGLIRRGLLRVERIAGRYVTCIDWVRECALRMYRPGLYYRRDTIERLSAVSDAIFRIVEPMRYVPDCGLLRPKTALYPAPAVYSASVTSGQPIVVPALSVSLALKRLIAVGVAVV